MALIQFTDTGLYCPQGDFYLDPWKPVNRAIITHAHSDHARWGSRYYLCQEQSLPILQLRLGAENSFQTAGWNETISFNGVKVSFHPAGHIIGSAQVRIEYKGEAWVFTGDFKTENDGVCTTNHPAQRRQGNGQRRHHAQKKRFCLPGGPQAWRLVEVEN